MKKYSTLLLILILAFVARPLLASFDTPGGNTTTQILLTEDQADKETSFPLVVPLHGDIEVKLLGSESNSLVYSSGSGSQYGDRWEWDQSSDGPLSVVSVPLKIVHGLSPLLQSFDAGNMKFNNGWLTIETSYIWTFFAEQKGEQKLTFKKYHYSNAKIFNIDGSSPWKDPTKEIHFTINVIDPSHQ
jgi:hypothetical protein